MAGDESQVGLSGGDLDKNTLGFGEPRGGVSRREREKEGGSCCTVSEAELELSRL